MKNHEYIIPKSEHTPGIMQPRVSYEYPTHQEYVNYHLKQAEDAETARHRLEKSVIFTDLSKKLETTREVYIQDFMLKSKKRKLGAIVDYITLGMTPNKFDAQAVWNKLVHQESVIGGELLDTRDSETHYYHYHDKNEWFWYAENKYTGENQAVRYRVEYGDIKRSVNGQIFEVVSEVELDNLLQVSSLYVNYVLAKIYGQSETE